MNKIKLLARRTLTASAVVTAVAFSANAQAALSAEEQAVLDLVTTKVTDYTAPAMTVVAAVLGLFIAIKWLKKIVGKVA